MGEFDRSYFYAYFAEEELAERAATNTPAATPVPTIYGVITGSRPPISREGDDRVIEPVKDMDDDNNFLRSANNERGDKSETRTVRSFVTDINNKKSSSGTTYDGFFANKEDSKKVSAQSKFQSFVKKSYNLSQSFFD